MLCHDLKSFDHDRPKLLQLASDDCDLKFNKKHPEERQTPKGGRALQSTVFLRDHVG